MKILPAAALSFALVLGLPQQSRAQAGDHDTRIAKLEQQVHELSAQVAQLAAMVRQQLGTAGGQNAMPGMKDHHPMGMGMKMGSQPQNPMGQMPPDAGGAAMPNQGGMGDM